MSHIETGNTKLSLPVFVDIANALSVQTDDLLHDIPQNSKTNMTHEINEILNSCTTRDMYILLDVLRSVKISLDKYSESDSPD